MATPLVALLAILLFTVHTAFILWLLVGLFARGKVAEWATPSYDAGKFKQALQEAEDHWRSVETWWDQETSDQRFVQRLRQLEHERDQLRQLPQLRQQRYQELERNRERQQLREFLERFEVTRTVIPSIGPGRKAMLESYNIDTAWDISSGRVMGVPGLGPALAGELLKSGRELEGKFRASKGVDPSDIALLDRQVAATNRKLEQSLVNGLPALNEIRGHILARRAALKPAIDEAARALAQARADFNALN